MNPETKKADRPMILAPAGNRASFLAALAAGADAVYCGLKQFSARKEVKNFSIEELMPLTRLAQEKGIKVYVALNALLKSDDLASAAGLVERLSREVKPDAIIIQDLSMVPLVRQAGYAGALHMSTLSNISFPAALSLVQKNLAVDRIVLPRELNIDEIKAMAAACPQGLDLEVFVHGALCYGVSGRCYWSSYLGGKSSLRGGCVQPCRRVYAQGQNREKFFSCQDLSLDVLVKVLLSIPQIRTWKIEGRKKGPHYVFYTVQAYRMLRDEGSDPKIKNSALKLLRQALGRPGTHYNFLPQRPQHPIKMGMHTGSGLFLGAVKGARGKPFIVAAEALLPDDVLRIGYEDDIWHTTYRVGRHVPAKGRLFLKGSWKTPPGKGTPVFLTDRREKALEDMLTSLENELKKIDVPPAANSRFNVRLPKKSGKKIKVAEMHVNRVLGGKNPRGRTGLWLPMEIPPKIPAGLVSTTWWWLPPVIWPENETRIKTLIDNFVKRGARNFVLNAPWQTAFFNSSRKLNLWAGPFCNIANPLAVDSLVSFGFNGVIVSPELGENDFLQLPKQSPLPLGIVIAGHWPLSVSRVLSERLQTEQSFISPKGEAGWIKHYAPDYWIYPNWTLDIRSKRKVLEKAGFCLFVHLVEPIPKGIKLKKRPGLWNWDLNLD